MLRVFSQEELTLGIGGERPGQSRLGGHRVKVWRTQQIPQPRTLTTPTLDLNDGRAIPQLGLGIYAMKGEEGVDAIVGAVDNVGYRLLDTAVNCENEREVGQAIADCSRRSRRACLVTSKIPGRHHGFDRGRSRAPEESLARLGLRLPRPPPHPLTQSQRRQVRQHLARAHRTARARAREVHRRLELHRGHAHRTHRRNRGHPRRKPGRAPPVLPAGRSHRLPPLHRRADRKLVPALP